MAQIHNSRLTKELSESAKIAVSRDAIPSQLAEKVVPVIDVHPDHNIRLKSFASLGSLSNATTFTWYTADANKDTFICAVNLSMIKDATSQATDMAMTYVDENGATQRLVRIAGITLTAQNVNITQSFPFPIKIKKGTSIILTSDSNAANIVMRACVQGYEIDNPNN